VGRNRQGALDRPVALHSGLSHRRVSTTGLHRDPSLRLRGLGWLPPSHYFAAHAHPEAGWSTSRRARHHGVAENGITNKHWQEGMVMADLAFSVLGHDLLGANYTW